MNTSHRVDCTVDCVIPDIKTSTDFYRNFSLARELQILVTPVLRNGMHTRKDTVRHYSVTI